jgi:hypothetical protein
VVSLLLGRGPSRIKPINPREEKVTVIPQQEASESLHEQASSAYGRYEGDQEYASQHDVTSYEHPLREGSGGKVYPPPSDNMFRQFVIVFVLSMVALFAFAVLCLVFVGSTGGWIAFIAASFAIMCIASTFIGMNAAKQAGGK